MEDGNVARGDGMAKERASDSSGQSEIELKELALEVEHPKITLQQVRSVHGNEGCRAGVILDWYGPCRDRSRILAGLQAACKAWEIWGIPPPPPPPPCQEFQTLILWPFQYLLRI